MNIFGALETDAEALGSKIKSCFANVAPLFKNLEPVIQTFAHDVIGQLPWAKMKDAVAAVVQSELTVAEAHNKLIALATSFVPGGDAGLANLIAQGAVSTVSGVLNSIPVPPASTLDPAIAIAAAAATKAVEAKLVPPAPTVAEQQAILSQPPLTPAPNA